MADAGPVVGDLTLAEGGRYMSAVRKKRPAHLRTYPTPTLLQQPPHSRMDAGGVGKRTLVSQAIAARLGTILAVRTVQQLQRPPLRFRVCGSSGLWSARPPAHAHCISLAMRLRPLTNRQSDPTYLSI